MKPRTITTVLGDDQVTYQVLAYRPLKAEEAKLKVKSHLSKTAAAEKPKPCDVVIIDTSVGLRSGS